MAHKAFLTFFVLFLSFSFVLSISADPTTRSLKSKKEDQSVLAQEAMDLRDGDEVFDVGERFIEGRMDFETSDYRGTGANPGHDPKPPGKA